MSRVHLFELQDQPWFPQTLGDAGVGYLRTLSGMLGADAFLAPAVQRALDRSGADHIVDLCAGAGGPTVAIAARLRAEGRAVPVTLTDRLPQAAARGVDGAVGVTAHPEPVDARAVPGHLTGLRTCFNAFHHFGDDDARAVLQDAVDAGQPVGVWELSERTAPSILSAAFIPLLVWLVMPRVRPVRWSWLALTYLLPVLPWSIAWDGLVSHLRTRNPDELRALVASLDAPGWTWEARRVAVKGPAGFTELVGWPPAA